MPIATQTSSVGEQIKLRRPRSHFRQPISESDPNPFPQIPSIIQSTRSKSTISSLLLSTFSNNTTSGSCANESLPRKKNNFSSATLRGLGCTAAASQQVSVPAVIRTSADWEKKKKKKGKKKQKNKTHQGIVVDGPHFQPNSNFNSASCLDAQDVWCGPGIGFSADDAAAAASVDCVVARRHPSGRGKIDLEKITHRERSCLGRRTVNPETLLFLDSDSDLPTARSLDVSRGRYYRHVRHPSPDGLAEIMMFRSSLLMGGRFDMHDRFRELRLDVDNMSYEELLELGERIGHVSTGLKEADIGRCVRKMKPPLVVNELPSHLFSQMDRKCSICQEDYEAEDEMGKLECGHSYHIHCIKQWLVQKNTCPVCKTAAVGRG